MNTPSRLPQKCGGREGDFFMGDLNANIREDIELTKEDRIITLVTCMSKQPEKRLLVQAVLNQE